MKALITGASSGIGYELAKIMHEKGHELVLVARRKDRLEAIKKELNCEIIVADLTKDKDIDMVFKKAKDIDILVNNAGFGLNGKFIETELEREFEMIDLNIKALVKLSKLYSKEMVKRKKGKIMNVASVAAYLPGPYMNVYFASKAFVLSFSQALSAELLGTGVTVTALCPGMTKTEFDKVAEIKSNHFKYGMSAQKVAMLGYNSMMKGKRVEITGTMNKLSICMRKVMPTSLLLLVMKKLQSV